MKNQSIRNYDVDETRMVTEDDLKEIRVDKNVDKKQNLERHHNTFLSQDKFNVKFFVLAFLIVVFSFLASFFIKRSFDLFPIHLNR